MSNDYLKPERLWLKNHHQFDEKWVQTLIAYDPSIIGLGDLVLRDRERIQPRAGRLDLLLQDLETQRRYEVELQLGPSDESHIIRTSDRTPQYTLEEFKSDKNKLTEAFMKAATSVVSDILNEI